MELDYKAIGKRVKIARIKAGFTQEQVCNKTGLSSSHMSNIETGSTKVGLPTLITVANVLGVTIDDLLYDNLAHARVQLERELQENVDSCNDYELSLIFDTFFGIIEATRRNERLLKNELGLDD